MTEFNNYCIKAYRNLDTVDKANIQRKEVSPERVSSSREKQWTSCQHWPQEKPTAIAHSKNRAFTPKVTPSEQQARAGEDIQCSTQHRSESLISSCFDNGLDCLRLSFRTTTEQFTTWFPLLPTTVTEWEILTRDGCREGMGQTNSH